MTHPMFKGLPTEGVAEHHLEELLYGIPEKGEDFKLYVYAYDEGTKHGGAQWFTSGRIRYPDEQVTALTAKAMVEYHMGLGHEVRITNGGDHLVFHSVEGKQLYPAAHIDFWSRV